MTASGTNISSKTTMDRGAVGRLSFVAVLACAWPALLLATVCLLPYLNKPFLVDDPEFLTMARQIAMHPMHPMDFDLCWNLRRRMQESLPLDAGECPDGVRARADSSGRRP